MRKFCDVAGTGFLILCAVVCLCLRAGAHEYVDTLLSPPTTAELNAVLERTQYTPQCTDFLQGDAIKKFDEGAIYRVTYVSDGYTQTGLLGVPAGAGPFALAVLNHAGFNGISGFDLNDAEAFVKRGYITASATYRGEGGKAGQAQGPVDVLGDEVHDIMNLMQCAVERPDVDPERIVMLGVSHGGGLTLSALLRDRRIKAAATLAAPLNVTAPEIRTLTEQWIKSPSGVEAVLSMLVSPDGIKKLRGVLGVRNHNPAALPERRFEILRRSPALFADRLTVPMLLYIGSEDPVSFDADCEAVAASLAARGIESKCTIFQGQGHAIKREDADAAREVIFEFFEKYLNEH